MTDAADVAGASAWSDVGLRRTKVRETVHCLLRGALREGCCPDAEALYRRALRSGARVSLGTIYRVLAEFEHAGVVRAHAFEGMRKVYELNDGRSRAHLVDLDSGRITHLPDEAIDAGCVALAESLGVELVYRKLTLYVRDRK